MDRPRILIFGVGSIGAVYLYQLQKAGCHVTAVCRSNYRAVRDKGFYLKSLRYGNQNYKPDHVVKSVDDCPRDTLYDYLLVCSKAFPGSKPSLADMIRPAIQGRKKTAIVLAQNGINIEEEVAQAYPENPLLSGVVYCPAVQTDPGVIEYTEMLNLFELGTYPSRQAGASQAALTAAEHFAQLMIKGGGQAKVYDDVQEARWKKLVMNAAWNPICALTLCTDGGFLHTSSPYAHELVWDLMMEIVHLATAIGIPGIDESVVQEKFSIAKRRAETNTGREMSMLQDVKHGRPFEVEVILGNTVRLGRQHKVPMPRLETVYALCKARHHSLMGGK